MREVQKYSLTRLIKVDENQNKFRLELNVEIDPEKLFTDLRALEDDHLEI